MTRRLFNRAALAALCGPGAEYIARPRHEWPPRYLWPRRNRPARPRQMRMVPGKARGTMNRYYRAG